jgi:hypothetical protein
MNEKHKYTSAFLFKTSMQQHAKVAMQTHIMPMQQSSMQSQKLVQQS